MKPDTCSTHILNILTAAESSAIIWRLNYSAPGVKLKYFVELSDRVPELTLGKLYAVWGKPEGPHITDDHDQLRYIHTWQDATGYVVMI